MRRIFYKLLVLFSLISQYSYSQINKADSAYLNTLFTEIPYVSYWNYPGKWFHHSELSSVQHFYDIIDSSYVFFNSEFADCYNHIQISNALESDSEINSTINNFEINNNISIYGNKNPFVKLLFTLNNKTAYSYAVMDSTSLPIYNNDYAFVIIPGTGNNMLKPIIDGTSYHDLNCYVRNLLKPMGDIYVTSMPNEDHRAIIFNKKKATSFPSYQAPYLINYLNSINKALGVNRLIETVALIKYLKTKYKKVFVLGLSTGGTVALWTSLLAEPDATLVASGYSVLVDNDYNSQLVNSMSYSNYLVIYNKDSVKNRMSQLHTQFLITQAMNDGDLVKNDIDSSITKNFLASLDNTSFFYNYYNHSFPPCFVIDSFLQRCISKPKVFFTEDTSICNKDSIKLDLQFLGTPPFTFDLFKNNVLIYSDTSNSKNYHLTLYTKGAYYIKNILDSNLNLGYTSDTFHYIKNEIPFAQISLGNFNCDSLKNELKFELTGKNNHSVFYTKNNIADSLIFTTKKDSFLFSNGDYYFNKIKDSRNCITHLNDHFNFKNPPLSFKINSIDFDCNLNKNIVSIANKGTFPLYLTFYDSVIQSYRNEIMNENDYKLRLDSGKYNFLYLKDSNNCHLTIDTFLNINNLIIFNEWIYIDKMHLKSSSKLYKSYYWYLDDYLYKETQEPYINLDKNGIYQLGVYNDLNCFLKTKKLEINLGKIRIFPNPIDNYIEIFISLEKDEFVKSNICDLSGKIIAQKELHTGLNYWILSDMPKGTYILSFNNNNKLIKYPSQKLLKY